MDIDDIERIHPSAQIAELVLQFEELLLRFPKRLPETLDLLVDQVRIAQFIKGSLCIEPVEKIGLADDDSRRNTDSLHDKRFFQIIVNHVIPCYHKSDRTIIRAATLSRFSEFLRDQPGKGRHCLLCIDSLSTKSSIGSPAGRRA